MALLAALASFSCTSRNTHAAGPRMIVIGVDGMDPDFLEAHWDSLPNLNKLRGQGEFRRLGTTIPPQSPVAWSTLITGMNPGGHGLFDFIHRDPVSRKPFSSMAESSEPSRTLKLGPYEIPLSGGGIRSLRRGRTFWELLADHGVRATVIRMPANFPPADCEAESLAGMGTPDMRGSFGTFTFFTDDPGERRDKVPGGEIVRVAMVNGRAALRIEGPVNTFRRKRPVSAVELKVDVDPDAPVARFELDDAQIILKEGEWSRWLRAEFPMVRGLKTAAGIFRVYFQKARPLRIYVSPVNIDPADPELPISTPPEFSRSLASAIGPFYTQGIAEEASALRAGIFSRDEFLVQSRKVLDDSILMFRHALAGFDSGLLFYYFSSVDQNSHMLWGRFDRELLEIYRAIDGAIGEAMEKTGGDATLVVMSDHGFARFDRAVHLNTWLMREGFLSLDDPTALGNEELFPHVDWSLTKAYALGLNGLYLNLEGRESGGAVPGPDRQRVLDNLAERLLAFRDPASGERVVEKVYFTEREFKGGDLYLAPDLIVGFRRGYRASWQTALGAVPKQTIEDNGDAWIGDHCMAAELVPGVLLANRKTKVGDPGIADVTATILRHYGVQPPAGAHGRVLF